MKKIIWVGIVIIVIGLAIFMFLRDGDNVVSQQDTLRPPALPE